MERNVFSLSPSNRVLCLRTFDNNIKMKIMYHASTKTNAKKMQRKQRT